MEQDSNATFQPRNLREAAVVEAYMRLKYPQMYTPEYQSRVAKARKKKSKNVAPVAQVKQARQEQKSSLEEALTGDEIKRLMGR